MNLEEALEASVTEDVVTINDSTIVVNNDLRTMSIPEKVSILGVESDESVNRLKFRLPRYYCDLDLGEFNIYVNYLNGRTEDIYVVTDKKTTSEYVEFSWLVGRNASKNKGYTKFVLCLKKSGSDGTVIKEFNTTVHKLEVLEGLETEVDSSLITQNKDLNDLIDQIKIMIDLEGEKVISNLPKDYQELINEVKALKESSFDNHNLIQVAINEFDGYRSLSDQVIENDGMHCAVSDFIPCVPKQKFRYKGFAYAKVYSACFFDSNKEIIGYKQYDSRYSYTEVEIPNNCYFVKFQSFGYKSSSGIAELDFKLTDSTDLKNMLSFPQMEENKKNIVKLEEKIGSSISKYKDLTSELLTLDVYINRQGDAVNADKGTALGSEYIKVEKGDMFRLTGYANYAVAGICQYDSNMRFLKAQLYSEDNTGYIYTNHEIEIDENTAYIRLCAYGISNHEYKIEKKCIVSLYDFINDYVNTNNEYDGNILKGKKWTACGDSFTEGDFTGFVDENGLSGKNSPVIYDGNRGMYKTYPWWIAERNNMELVNEAKCGSKFTNVDNATSGNVFSLRYKNVPLDSDYITFMFGLNEVGLTDAQIGTESDSDITTLWGAYNVIFEYFLTNAPKAKMLVIIPDAWMNKKYADATKTICDHWGIVCRDLKFDTSVTMGIGGRSNVSLKATELRDKAFKVTDKNGHPNVVAHEYRSTVIESWMRAL